MTQPAVPDVIRELAHGAVVLSLAFVPKAWQDAASDGLVHDVALSVVGSHAVVAVGSCALPLEQQQCIIIKNSWGPRWGDGGYGYVTNAYFDRHIIVAHVLAAAR